MTARSRLVGIPALRELAMPAAVVAVGAVALAAKTLLVPVNMYDAGISASAGTFILHGLVPYRDFWMLYGPLGGYLSALIGLVAGPSTMVVQLVGLALVASQAAAGYLLLRCLQAAPLAALLIAMVSAAASVLMVGLEISAWQCAIIASLLALAVAFVADTPRAVVLAGAVAGVALLFRQDVGCYALVAVLVACRSPRPLVGFGLITGPVVLILLAIAPTDALYEQLVWYPIVGLRLYRAVPNPLSTTSGPAADVLMVIFVWGARASIAAAAVRAFLARDAAPAGLIVFAVLCQLQTVGRGDFYHFAQAAGPAFLCLGTVFTPETVARKWGAAALGGAVALLMVVGAIAIPVAGANAASYQTSVDEAVAFIRQSTVPTEPIFVGLTSNRYTLMNPLMIYYLADRAPGVRDTMYNPGVTNRDATQGEMIAELTRSRTRYLVLDRLFAAACEPFNASCEPGSSRLDEFIASEFRTAADFGDVLVMVRR